MQIPKQKQEFNKVIFKFQVQKRIINYAMAI